jgi:hypothetical protein
MGRHDKRRATSCRFLGDEEGAVMRHRYADGGRPNRGVVHNEASHEVLIFAGRHTVLEERADHLVAGPFLPVPRAVVQTRRRDILRELVAIVIRAHVIPGPAVESAVTHTRNEVRNEIVAEAIPLVGRAIQVPRHRVHGEPNAVSQRGGYA